MDGSLEERIYFVNYEVTKIFLNYLFFVQLD